MSKFGLSGIAAALMGGAMLFSGAQPLSAATLPSPAVFSPGDTAVVEQVQSRREARRELRRDRRQARREHRAERRYDRRRHGARYSHRRPGFGHHYGGYYYSSPWWSSPGIGFSFALPGVALGLAAPGYGSGHVEWCLNRFRSYDPASDTYLGYDGYRHRCNSPY